MQNIRKSVLLSSVVLLALFISLSSVSAVDIGDGDVSSLLSDDAGSIALSDLSEDAVGDDYVLCSDSSSKSSDVNSDDGPQCLKESTDTESDDDSVYYVDSDRFDSFFDSEGVLREGFNDSELVFVGEFVDKGVLHINSSNVCIKGNDTLLDNTVFSLEADNVMLTGLNFVLDEEFSDNGYAGIFVLGDNCTVYNCTMNYTVPEDKDGFCVYCKGYSDDLIQNVSLVNNEFNFIGGNFKKGRDYGIFIDHVNNAMIYGNSINASMPLRTTNWGAPGVSKDYVAVIALQYSPNLTVSHNNVSSYARGARDILPTLDTIILCNCNNATFESNSIYSEDFLTANGKDNYLYGLDLYFSDDVTILGNQIHIRTTGGSEMQGTAYPIQVTGPSNNIKIAYNNISSVSFGPNIGIYSENYFGATKIDIISNFINVTGVAGIPEWSLVAGIEVQDSNDLIWNNTIIVTNMGSYMPFSNVYGISYSQNINGNHTYNIQYNNITTNGRYAVSLAGSSSLVTNSIVANNILNTKKYSGNKTVRIGMGDNNTVYNNTDGAILDPNDLPDWLKNYKSKIPLILMGDNVDEDSNGSGFTEEKGNGTSLGNGSGDGRSHVSSNGNNSNSDRVLGSDHDTAPGIGGDSAPSVSAASPEVSGSSAANPDAYEINDHENLVVKSVAYVQLAIICVLALLLLGFGYKRQKDNEEEE